MDFSFSTSSSKELTILGNQAGFIANWDKPSGGLQSLNIFFTYAPVHTSSPFLLEGYEIRSRKIPSSAKYHKKESRTCQFKVIATFTLPFFFRRYQFKGGNKYTTSIFTFVSLYYSDI